VGILGAVIQIPVLSMLDAGQDLAHGGTVASQLIRDDHSWDLPQALEQFAEELLGCGLVPTALHQDIEHLAILIHGPPQIMPWPLHRQKHLIQMPPIPRAGVLAAELMGIGLPELWAPIAHGFIGQDDAPFSHQLLDIAIAQAEAEVQPDAVADDLCREPMALIQVADGWCGHTASMPRGWQLDKRGTLI
jgi:hypothetical protein